jgi:hypothetical protein
VRENMEREGERNYIMQVVCEATQSQSIPVVVGAFECLVKIMQLYYDKMGFYMEQALFGVRRGLLCCLPCGSHRLTHCPYPAAHRARHAQPGGEDCAPGDRVLVDGLRRGD